MNIALAFLAFLGQQPNVILIRTDDMDVAPLYARRPDNGELVFKNLRALIAAQGTTFGNSFVSFSLCTPSRAAVLSGQYAHNNGVFGNMPPFGGYGAFDHTNALPVWLQAAGYYTVHVGKYMNWQPNNVIPPGWSEWFGCAPFGYYNYHVNENGTEVYYGTSPSDYNTDVMTAKAVAFILEGRSREQPFYMAVDYYAPHRGGTIFGNYPPAPRHNGVMATHQPVHGPAYDEADVSDKPLPIRNLPQFTPEVERAIDIEMRGRLGTLLAVDEGIAQIVRALADVGKLEDTLIIFTSDNGYQQGEHRLPTGKQAIYEESVKVPLIVRGPGVRAAWQTWALVANIDIAPTLVDLAGATAGRVMDGRSLAPLLRGEIVDWDRDLLFENFSYSFFGGPLHRPLSAIRYRGGLYAEYDYDGDGVVDERELYDMRADPFQLQSQHADPLRVLEMRRRSRDLVVLQTCVGVGCW